MKKWKFSAREEDLLAKRQEKKKKPPKTSAWLECDGHDEKIGDKTKNI